MTIIVANIRVIVVIDRSARKAILVDAHDDNLVKPEKINYVNIWIWLTR